MKIFILFDIKSGPYGGGNQFLKALKKMFIERGVYEDSPIEADCILFNSFPFDNISQITKIYKLKKKYPDKIFIHRIDGPIFKIRGRDFIVDKLIYKLNNIFADGTVFQSKWCMEKNISQGMGKPGNYKIIFNAPDPLLFNPAIKQNNEIAIPIKIVAVSWSQNLNKGFGVYKYIDEHIDKNKYQFTFIGNSPIKFTKSKKIDPLPSKELAEEIARHDIYLTASKNDPCSNSLIEALHLGLPAVVLGDGGHPEIVKKGGITFNRQEEIFPAIDMIANDYQVYKQNIDLPDLERVADEYFALCSETVRSNKKPARIKTIMYLYVLATGYFWRFKNIFS